MAKEVKISTAMAETIGMPGRIMATARDRPVLIDSSAGRSGVQPGALTAGETFLAALIGCGAVIVDATARERGVNLAKAVFKAESGRYPEDPSNYVYIKIDVETEGVTQEEAEALVGAYKAECPIFRLAERGSDVTVTVTAR